MSSSWARHGLFATVVDVVVLLGGAVVVVVELVVGGSVVVVLEVVVVPGGSVVVVELVLVLVGASVVVVLELVVVGGRVVVVVELVEVDGSVVVVLDVVVEAGSVVVVLDVVVVAGSVVVVLDVVVVAGSVVVVDVLVVGGSVVVVVATAVTPQTDWPMKMSPTAVGPNRRSWAAFTVIEPSGLTVCSLKMYWKLSCEPLTWMCPLITRLGVGLAGRFTVTAGCTLPAVSSPLSVCSVPPVIVVEAVRVPSTAVQVLVMFAAVSASWLDVFNVATLAELVTDPFGPGVPWVLTVMGPEESN